MANHGYLNGPPQFEYEYEQATRTIGSSRVTPASLTNYDIVKHFDINIVAR